jgi:hypothetical protein
MISVQSDGFFVCGHVDVMMLGSHTELSNLQSIEN